MNDIIVTGHRNPDMDSVCAAHCYAEFKNITDRSNNYIPVRCGNLNNQTKQAFKAAGVKPPVFIKDVSPKVSDVTRRDIESLDINEPVFNAIKVLDEENISCIPVFEDGLEFRGIITIHQISGFLISENLGRRPVYKFRINNFQNVLPGFFYKRGSQSEFSAPVMTGAMPIEVSRERIEALKPEKPVLVVGLRDDLINFAIENEFPAIILTGVDDKRLKFDFDGYDGTVFISKADTAETIRLLRLSAPVKVIMNPEPEKINAESAFDDAKNLLVNSNYRGLPVFNGESFSGIVTRRCFIEKPLRKLILVDHNETSQSVAGADQAKIVEIIDHHRISPQPTKTPIYMNIRPVGSTCTIVYSHFEAAGLEISKETAMLLLSGILSDTVILKSPTTTDEDSTAALKLAELCGCTVEEYGSQLFAQSAVIDSMPPAEIIGADFKEYSDAGLSFGVGQAEVINLDGVNRLKDELVAQLERTAKTRDLDWAMLLITDVIKEHSVLLMTNMPAAEKLLVYKKLEDNLFDLPGILSRKKQLLPELLRVVEELKVS
ncbi:MAG: putative manganese-dependent inorganic diphosphatase [Spirochaetales bacterium]|uniref:inorganic diphosphatase n=1 Tax=Candidatus Thalassospirochaeta sargassi TaxID=3119039 RepID=A0AAJ1MK76_9SPIO|nr:putative manganese-dependent inorganic diphosphatase [Spirochaetales bacterium]